MLADAKVGLNPQVDAALFAIQSPLSRGVVLADEVGLGKTIEAALVIAQRWAERASEIVEGFGFRRNGIVNAFDREGTIVICSCDVAAAKASELRHIAWDLVVMDVSHRLRNVHKKSSRIAASIRHVIDDCEKLLLTTTPLQSFLMELYGLASVAASHVFGDERSFREQFADAGDGNDAAAQRRSINCTYSNRCCRKVR